MRNATFATLGLVTILAAGSGIVGHELVPGFLHPYRAPMPTRRLARVDAMLERVHATREDFDVPAQDGIVLPGAGYKTDIAVSVGKEQTSET